MKKLLALVLALVMTLGLATVGANAATTAYKDADKINYKEAVDVMSAVGILAGDETGFRPTDNLKRSEGAKIIAYMLLGNKSADSLSGSGAKFSDVPANHWAAGYIEYLAAQGVIGGVGDGKFNPDGTLTTVQFAKMLLTALGYDAEIEKLGGPDWSINTQKLANQTDVKLFKGNNSVSANSNITREEAALYAFNTLRTPLVQYESKGSSINVNGASITTGASNVSYKTDTAFKNQKISNKRLNEGQGINVTPYLVEFAEFYYPDLELVGQDESYNNLGQPTRKWTWKNTEIGTYVMSGWLVKTWEKKATAKDVYDTVGQSVYDALLRAKWNGTNNALSEGTTLTVFADGANQWTGRRVGDTNGQVAMGYPDPANFGGTSVIRTNKDTTGVTPTTKVATANDPYNRRAAGTGLGTQGIDFYVSRTDTTAVSSSGNGSVTELYQDDDNNLILVTYHTYLYKVAGEFSTTGGTLMLTDGNTNSKLLEEYRVKETDFPQIKDYKDGDYVVVTVSLSDNNRYKVESIAKAEIVTGKVEQYNTSGDENVILDGTTYKYSKMVDDDTKNTHYTVGQKAAVVLDGHGYVIYVDDAHATDDYVFVKEFGSTSSLKGDARAAVIFADGTEKEISIKSVEWPNSDNRVTTKTTIAKWGKGEQALRWYEYSKDSNGDYALYSAESKYQQLKKTNYAYAAGGDNEISSNNKALFLDGFSQMADDKTIVIVKEGDRDIQVFNGVKNTPEITLGNSGGGKGAGTAEAYVLYNKNNNYARLVYIVTTGNATVSGGSGENLVYVIKYNTKTTGTDNEVWHEYKVLEEGKETTVQADQKIQNGEIYRAAYYVSKNSKDQLTKFELVPDANNGQIADKSVWSGRGAENSISYNDGVIKLAGCGFAVNDNTKITIVRMGGTKDVFGDGLNAKEMNGDKAKDYEVDYGKGQNTIKSYTSIFSNYSYKYDWVVKTTGSKDNLASDIMITVRTAEIATTLSAAAAKNGGIPNTAGAKVTINGNVELKAGEYLIVPAGVTAIFTGNVTAPDTTADNTVTINGTATVQGNLTLGETAAAQKAGSGEVTVLGTYTNSGAAPSFTVKTQGTVTGATTNLTVSSAANTALTTAITGAIAAAAGKDNTVATINVSDSTKENPLVISANALAAATDDVVINADYVKITSAQNLSKDVTFTINAKEIDVSAAVTVNSAKAHLVLVGDTAKNAAITITSGTITVNGVFSDNVAKMDVKADGKANLGEVVINAGGTLVVAGEATIGSLDVKSTGTADFSSTKKTEIKGDVTVDGTLKADKNGNTIVSGEKITCTSGNITGEVALEGDVKIEGDVPVYGRSADTELKDLKIKQ